MAGLWGCRKVRKNLDGTPLPAEPGGEARVHRLVEEAFDRKRRAA